MRGGGQQSVQGGKHLLPALPPPGHDADHRQPQRRRERRTVHPDAPARRLVQQVHTDQHPRAELPALERQVQVPPEAARVTDHDHRLRPAIEQEVPGHPLLLRAGQQGVAARQIHQGIVPAAAPGGLHGLPRPVPGMLPEPGQLIEQGALPHVGVSRQGYDPLHSRASTSILLLSRSRRAMAAPQRA